MNLSKLLSSRQSLIEQTRLANMAYAYVTLKRLAAVFRRAGLVGPVQVQQPNEMEERYWATLTPLACSQSVADEHFSEDDVAALADAISFITGVTPLDITFRIENLDEEFIAPLAVALEHAGVSLEEVPDDASDSSRSRLSSE